MIQVAYADNKVFTEAIYLQMWLSKRFNLKGIKINLEFNTITNELSFPYVPNGYNRVIIK
jgi:hypothetical protein